VPGIVDIDSFVSFIADAGGIEAKANIKADHKNESSPKKE
jgi:hypothetical protein